MDVARRVERANQNILSISDDVIARIERLGYRDYWAALGLATDAVALVSGVGVVISLARIFPECAQQQLRLQQWYTRAFDGPAP